MMVENTHCHYWKLIFLVANLSKRVAQERTTPVTTTLINVVRSALLPHVVTSLFCARRSIF